MGRPSLNDLGAPPPECRVDRVPAGDEHGFETVAACEQEDALRAQGLRAAQLSARQQRKAQRLADKLEEPRKPRQRQRGKTGPRGPRSPRGSMASSVDMRDLRLSVSGWLWWLLTQLLPGEAATITLIPRGWRVSAKQLERTDPRKLLAAVRSDLNRVGAGKADGWLILFTHGEYEPRRDRFQLHLHGIATGGMVGVLDALRKRHKYRTRRKRDGKKPDFVAKRVVMSRGELTDLPYPLTYLLKSYWVSRWQGRRDGGKRLRQRRGQRIPEPRHSQYLLWLDRWSLRDLSLLLHVQVTKRGLEVNHKEKCTQMGKKGGRK